MVFPKEKYEELEQIAQDAENEKLLLLKDTEALTNQDGSLYYQPNEPAEREKRKKLIQQLELLNQSFIKNEIDSAAQAGIIEDFLTRNETTFEELSGRYESSVQAKGKAFMNSLNKNIAQNEPLIDSSEFYKDNDPYKEILELSKINMFKAFDAYKKIVVKNNPKINPRKIRKQFNELIEELD